MKILAKEAIDEKLNSIFLQIVYKEISVEKSLQYMKMVENLRNFVKADRLGNWDLHLTSTKEVLPFFAFSGHNEHTTCARLYLQNMLEVKHSSPNIH